MTSTTPEKIKHVAKNKKFIYDMRAGYSLCNCERNARSSFLLLNFLLIFHLNCVIIIMSEREVILWPK